MPFLYFKWVEDGYGLMHPRSIFYKHPYAISVTVVFLLSLLVTSLYFFELYPGVAKTQARLDGLLTITGILFVTTVATWTTGILLKSDPS